jgi:hypothetical protein
MSIFLDLVRTAMLAHYLNICIVSCYLFCHGQQSHVCVLQTALDLLDLGYQVHVLADGVSSCNKEEVPFALARIRQAGGITTSSESAVFQLMRTFVCFFLWNYVGENASN